MGVWGCPGSNETVSRASKPTRSYSLSQGCWNHSWQIRVVLVCRKEVFREEQGIFACKYLWRGLEGPRFQLGGTKWRCVMADGWLCMPRSEDAIGHLESLPRAFWATPGLCRKGWLCEWWEATAAHTSQGQVSCKPPAQLGRPRTCPLTRHPQ